MGFETDYNREKYESADVVSYYGKQTKLQPCEAYLFRRYLRPGLSILDMGVGGGRTSLHLAEGACRYVGVDYSQGMVDACRRRFPHLEFRLCDATDISEFSDAEFDAVVFSFNGIDYIPTDEGRNRCFSEVARVLKQGGIFIFSSHHARVLGVWPQFGGARVHQMCWRVLRSIFKSASLAARTLGCEAYRVGQGFIEDPGHGGMRTYVSTPLAIRSQVEPVGLRVVETVGGHFPNVSSDVLTPWFYYVCAKDAGPFRSA